MSALPRRQAPSPLQVTQISTPISETFSQVQRESLVSSQTLRGGIDRPGILDRSETLPVHRNVPQESTVRTDSRNLDESSTSAWTDNGGQENVPSNKYESPSTSSPLTTPKGRQRESRKTHKAHSSTSIHATESPPSSPIDMPPPKLKIGVARPERQIAPRTSSIDSTMSSVSSTASYTQYSSQDPMSPNPAEVAQMIATAGSAEALIRQMVKEKTQSTAQNAQLWRLVNKQRTLILGLNADLKRAEQDKERYRKRLKDTNNHSKSRVGQVEALQRSSPAASTSPAPSEDDCPTMQEGSLESAIITAPVSSRTIPEREDVGESGKTFVPLSSSAPASSQIITAHAIAQADTVNLRLKSTRADDSRRNTVIQSSVKAAPPLEAHKKFLSTWTPSYPRVRHHCKIQTTHLHRQAFLPEDL